MTRFKYFLAVLTVFGFAAMSGASETETMVIDDFSRPGELSALGTSWRGVSDRVMGGVSQAIVDRGVFDGRPALRLSGDVRLENNGGFIQASLALSTDGSTFDASAFTGIRLTVRGNGERYGVHLRTPDNVRPWQSYRAEFVAGHEWRTIDLAFSSFKPHRLETPLDVSRLKRIGLVAIGRAFTAELVVADLRLYR